MTKTNNLDSEMTITEADRIKTLHKKVKHGKLKIQRKKIKSQILKGHTPRDIKRENICKNARKTAHSTMANLKRDISNDVRKGMSEGLVVIDESATTISGRYGLDFMEESAGWEVGFEFFEKPVSTPITESLSIGTTPSGRKRKCKAIGIAEGVFAPITDASGQRVFSRNHRLYESDHWDYQLENLNFSDRVKSRRMLGTIGHMDKKVDDKDLREGIVSHIVTDLEIREDDVHGRYLWGRLEILNTPAGKLLKEYYDNDIPMFVSSRGGGKLMEVAGKDYKIVDKKKYFCECFDVVKEPGYLEAAPIYYGIDETNEELDDLITKLSDMSGVDKTKLYDVFHDNCIKESLNENTVIEEDDIMTTGKVNVNVDTTASTEEIINKLMKPMSEKLSMVVDAVTKIQSDLYEDAEEAPAEEAPKAEEKAEEKPAEAEVKAEEPANEDKAEETPAETEEVKAEEAPAEEKPAEEIKEEAEGEKEVAPAEEKPAEVAPAEEPKAEEVAEAKKEEDKDEKKECPKCGKKECDCKDKKDKEEKVDEQWAHQDPKETVTTIKDFPNAKNAKEDPEGKAMLQDCIDDAKKVAKDVNGGIQGGAKATVAEAVEGEEAPKAEEPKEEAPAEEKPAEEIKEEAGEEAGADAMAQTTMQQMTDYKAMYEALEAEVDECKATIDEIMEMFTDLGKKYKEVIVEKQDVEKSLANIQEQLNVANKELNSYKLVEKFNITVEKANELLGSKDYDSVVEELKEAEATQMESEAKAKAEAVSEAISESATPKATVTRRVFSAFSAPINESVEEKEEISESVTESPRKRKVYSVFSR